MNRTHYHTTLANYFTSRPHFFDGDKQKQPNIRKCMEQPWQQTKAALWDEVTETLCDLIFIQAKACAKQTYDLVKDYNFTLDGLPEYQPEKEKEHKRQERLDKYTQDLIACAEGKISRFDLKVPESITPWTEEQIDAEIERIKNNPTRADKLKDFINFLGQEAANLQNYASEFAFFSYQQAWNFTKQGLIGEMATEIDNKESLNLLLKIHNCRPLYIPLPQKEKIFKIGNFSNRPKTNVIYPHVVSITSDGTKAISSSKEYFLIYWDLKTGRLIRLLKGHTAFVTSISISPDGGKAISGSVDKHFIYWDLKKGIQIKKYRKENENKSSFIYNPKITTLCFTNNDQEIILGAEDNSCVHWNLKLDIQVKKLYGHTKKITKIVTTPDGKKAITGSFDKTCILWDLDTGKILNILKGHEDLIYSVDITPDGKLAISSSNDKTCIVWDLLTGKELKVLKGHTDGVTCVAITPDGKRAISGSFDNSCILWNIEDEKQINIFWGHTGKINDVSIWPDGTKALSCASDDTCILWDLKFKYRLPQAKFRGGIKEIISIPRSKTILSTHNSNPVGQIWNIDSGRYLGELNSTEKMKHFEITPNGEKSVSFSWMNNTCYVWDLSSKKCIKTLKHSKNIESIVISPNGKYIISVTVGKALFIWNLKNGLIVKKIKLDSQAHEIELTITPNGKNILVSNVGIGDYSIVIDTASGKKIKKIKNSIASYSTIRPTNKISPDGSRALITSGDNSLLLLDMLTFEKIAQFFHKNNILNSIISPDGKYAYSVSDDKTCKKWDLITGNDLGIIYKHSDIINALAIDQTGSHLFLGTNDSVCIIINIDSKNIIAIYPLNSSISSILIKYNRILIGCGSGEILMFFFDIRKLNKIPIATINKKSVIFKKYFVDCPACGHNFKPQKNIRNIIADINKKYRSSSYQYYLELPDKVCEDSGLLSECPKCGQKLKFNPFIAGSD